MPDTATQPSLLETLRERHAELLKTIDDLIDEREAARAEFEAKPGDEEISEEEQRKRKAELRIEESERDFRRSFGSQMIERELVSPFEKRVSPNRLPGQGGEFVPPKWQVDDYSPYLRAGRVVAPLTNNMPLPP